MISLRKGWWWPALAVPLAFGLGRLRFDAEVLNLLPDRIPIVRGLKLYQENFADRRELIVTLRAPDAETAESAAWRLAEFLRRETNLVASAIWQPPWAEHPEQMAELTAYLWLNQPAAAFAQLTNRLAPDKLELLLREAREQLSTSLSPIEIGRLSYDPFGLTRLPETGLGRDAMFGAQQERFTSMDGTFRVMFVEARGELLNFRASAAWLNEIKAVVGQCQNSPEWPGRVVVRFTGAPAFNAEIGTGMERDMQGSVLCVLVVVAGLFWWAHRNWHPLMWIIALLLLITASTLALGGLIFGRLNAVSLGFAAILFGLAVDYCLVLYQESVAAPRLSAREMRRLIAPSIAWSAVTTAAAFGLLNFAGLPGLSQFGSLVAIGVLLAAVAALYAFLPVILRRDRHLSNPAFPVPGSPHEPKSKSLAIWPIVTVAAACAALVILLLAWPRVDHSARSLQPGHSPSQVALDELQEELNQRSDPFLLVVCGRDEEEVACRLEGASDHLSRAGKNHEVRSILPTLLWPHAERQRVNLTTANQLATRAEAMRVAALKAGFTSNAVALAESVLRTWRSYHSVTNAIWPTNQSCEWLLKRVVARNSQDLLAVGMIYPGTNGLTTSTLAKLDPGLPGVWLTSWRLLGEVLLRDVEGRLWWVMAAMVVTVGVCLWLAFRQWTEVMLSFATFGFSLLLLLAVMGLAGWSWNLMNLVALPLLLGTGVDYTIHIQLALRRHGGDALTMRRVTGRAVFLCAATTAVGFGSNALSSNSGLASLGLVCSAGIAIVYLSSTFLLPAWWVLLRSDSAPPRRGQNLQPEVYSKVGVKAKSQTPDGRSSATPSSLYRAGVWRLGLVLVRILPARILDRLVSLLAEGYYRLQRTRREAVIGNLLPVLQGDRSAAEKTARRLFRNFALKLVDLWRFEGGMPVRNWMTNDSDRNIIQSVQARGRGVLFITLHLGNWELGGVLLADFGMKLTVLSLAEPDAELTELRTASRARWGIETLIIGQDGFAFVRAIERLQAGAAVAISIDRPPERGAVQVEVFGKPFAVSVAAAELARAAGCALVGVTVVRKREGFALKVLPEFIYDREALGSREARRELTQQILRAFEPEIRKHLDQWYHFILIWPKSQ
jgi:predicted RND superfamily exporter protein